MFSFCALLQILQITGSVYAAVCVPVILAGKCVLQILNALRPWQGGDPTFLNIGIVWIQFVRLVEQGFGALVHGDRVPDPRQTKVGTGFWNSRVDDRDPFFLCQVDLSLTEQNLSVGDTDPRSVRQSQSLVGRVRRLVNFFLLEVHADQAGKGVW